MIGGTAADRRSVPGGDRERIQSARSRQVPTLDRPALEQHPGEPAVGPHNDVAHGPARLGSGREPPDRPIGVQGPERDRPVFSTHNQSRGARLGRGPSHEAVGRHPPGRESAFQPTVGRVSHVDSGTEVVSREQPRHPD